MTEVAVVHLVWVPYGVTLLERFLASYKRHSGGLEHEVIIVFNGYQDRKELAPFEAALEGVTHRPLYLETPQQDLDNYFTTAAQLPHTRLCFVNSYSQIQDDEWLSKLHRTLCLPGVGVVGATGSWQSMRWTYPPLSFHFSSYAGRGLRMRRAEYIDWLRCWKRYFAGLQTTWKHNREYRHPPFPNPHIRTTGFIIDRERFLSLRHAPMRNKKQAMLFESGPDSLTRQIQQVGLKTLVVGKDGRAYEPDAWPLSQTYRQGAQRNLLITDNRTGDYADGNLETRRELARGAWGDKAEAVLDAVPGEVNAQRTFNNSLEIQNCGTPSVSLRNS